MITMATDEATALSKAVDSTLSKQLGDAIRAAVAAGSVVRLDWDREQAAIAVAAASRVSSLFEETRRILKHQHQIPAAVTLACAVRRIRVAYPDA